jgi:hypothetical protein
MKRAVSLLAGLIAVGITLPVSAACVCRCVNGEVRPICSSSIDLEPICAPRVCPIVPPSVEPINRPRVPPVGTQNCRMVQVLNPRTAQYEWRQVCQ